MTRHEDGIVLIGTEKGKGNREPAKARPYGAIYDDEERDVALKRTLCAHFADSQEWLPPASVPREQLPHRIAEGIRYARHQGTLPTFK